MTHRESKEERKENAVDDDKQNIVKIVLKKTLRQDEIIVCVKGNVGD